MQTSTRSIAQGKICCSRGSAHKAGRKQNCAWELLSKMVVCLPMKSHEFALLDDQQSGYGSMNGLFFARNVVNCSVSDVFCSPSFARFARLYQRSNARAQLFMRLSLATRARAATCEQPPNRILLHYITLAHLHNHCVHNRPRGGHRIDKVSVSAHFLHSFLHRRLKHCAFLQLAVVMIWEWKLRTRIYEVE